MIKLVQKIHSCSKVELAIVVMYLNLLCVNKIQGERYESHRLLRTKRCKG